MTTRRRQLVRTLRPSPPVMIAGTLVTLLTLTALRGTQPAEPLDPNQVEATPAEAAQYREETEKLREGPAPRIINRIGA